MSPNKNEHLKLDFIEKQIEALLFVSPEPVRLRDLADYLNVSITKVENSIKKLNQVYKVNHGFRLIKISNGWQMVSDASFAKLVEGFLSTVSSQKVRLSKAAFETLSVIAYNQPVTRSEIEEIRSVRSDRVVDTLVKHGLVRIAGRKKSIGLPLLYRTTDRFLEIFGLASISALPSLEELKDQPYTVDEILNETFVGERVEYDGKER